MVTQVIKAVSLSWFLLLTNTTNTDLVMNIYSYIRSGISCENLEIYQIESSNLDFELWYIHFYIITYLLWYRLLLLCLKLYNLYILFPIQIALYYNFFTIQVVLCVLCTIFLSKVGLKLQPCNVFQKITLDNDERQVNWQY